MYDALQTVNAGGETFDRSARSFFGAMAGFILLDAVLLLWLLNPFAGLAPRNRAYPLVDRTAVAAFSTTQQASVDKPSPFGTHSKPAASKVAARRGIATAAAFVEVDK